MINIILTINDMKSRIFTIVLLISFFTISCSDKYDDTAIRNDISDLTNRVQNLEKLCKDMNTNISSLQTLVDALQQNDCITEITPIMENGKEIGYTINFLNHNPITIYHGKDGQNGSDGQNGITPQLKIENSYWYISYDQGKSWQQLDKATAGDVNIPQFKIENDYWYVSYNNGASWEWLGKATGEDGENGTNANTPQLKIVDGYWYVSYDNGSSWEQLGKATGENGSNGQDATIPQFIIQDGYWYISYDNGNTWQQLGKATGEDGNTPQFKIENDFWCVSYDNGNTWIWLGKAIGDNVYTPLFKIEDGYWYVSYDNGNTWNWLGKATGSNGNDGNTPQIGVRKDTDGIYYWTLNGNWLLDDAGKKVQAQGMNGGNGSDGTDGEDGKDGITPQLKIENDYWHVSYDNGNSWQQLGKATSENGSSIFEKVDYLSNEDYVTFKLTNGESFNLPKSKSIDIIFERNTDIGVFPNTTLEIPYTITGKVSEDIQVEAIGTEGLKAKVIPASTTEGCVQISVPAEINEYSRVLVFLIMKDRTITRAFTFENGIFEIINDGIELSNLQTIFTIPVTTNMLYSYKIDNNAQEWLYGPSLTKAAHTDKLSFSAMKNEGTLRSAVITFFDNSNQVQKKFIVTQAGADLHDCYSIKGDTAIIYLDRTNKEDIEKVLYQASHLTVPMPSVYVFKGRDIYPLDLSVWDNPIRKLAKYTFSTQENNLKVLDFSNIKNWTKIPNYAFATFDETDQNECFTTLEKIILPATKTIKEIGERAFYKVKATIENFPSNATNLGSGAFENCVSLTSVKLFNIIFLGDNVFKDCPALVSIEAPNIQDISNHTFDGCESLKTIDLPTAKTIGDEVFKNCTALTSVNFPVLTELGYNPFSNCTALTTANMPNITELKSATFRQCSSLVTANFPKVTNIGDRTFEYCSGLTTVNLPEVTIIDRMAFYSCNSLTYINIPKVTTIKEAAFKFCSQLSSVDLPKVEVIEKQAFGDCRSLTVVDFPEANSVRTGAFTGCTTLATINLPNVTYLYSSVFENCTSLTELKLTSPSLGTVNTGFIDLNISSNVRLYLNENQSKNVNGNLWNNLMWKEIIYE